MMRAIRIAVQRGLLMACGMASAVALAQGAATQPPPVARPAGGSAPSPAVAPTTDPTAIGHGVLNAGPDARVDLEGLSRDHAAIFGTDDENERALLDSERALQAQREQLRVLERLLTGTPPAVAAQPPAMIPLNGGAPMTMPRLAPAPSGSHLDRTNGATRRSVDEMERRVNGLRRDADALGQGER